MRATRSITPVLLLLSASFALQGCATNQDLEALRSDINRLQMQIAGYQDNLSKLNQELQVNITEHNQQLRAQNRDIQTRVEELATVEEVIKKNQADINAKIDSMTSSLAALGGKSEEGQASAMGLGAKLDSLNATLNQRLDGMDRSINQLGASVSAMEKKAAERPATGEKPNAAAESETPAAGDTGSVPAGDPTEIYQSAYEDYTKGNFDLAITGFDGFLKDFPNASLAPNAQYWLGECYYSKREFDRAVEEFDKVIKKYPGAIKVPSAYLKKGFVLDEKGEKEAAKAQYRKILDAYPLAPEAAIAKERLKAKK